MTEVYFFSNPRTKVNSVKHAVFLEKEVAKIRMANSSTLARMVVE